MSSSVYKKLLGEQYQILPIKVQQLHDVTTSKTYTGRATVVRGTNILARAIATLLSLPKSAEDIPITVQFEPEKNAERWRRSFDQDQFNTLQWAQNDLLYERAGAATLVFKPIVSSEGLSLELEKVYLLGIPLPRILYPEVITHETQSRGRYNFYVRVTSSWAGLIVCYEGSLIRQEWQ